MMKISLKEKSLIEAAVAAAEKNTKGEIVPVFVESSGNYRDLVYLGALVGLLLSSGVHLLGHFYFPFLEAYWLMALQLVGALLGARLVSLPPILRIIAGPARLQREAHEGAIASFFGNGLHRTQDRTGILIYISHLEHRVEILADDGIHQKVGSDFWNHEVKKIVEGIKAGNPAGALEIVIGEMGVKLAEHFPSSQKNPNELGDSLRSK